ncbi:MAG: UDP-N-acetylmuramoylalanine-D-glutamate ligase [Candidatus Kaiserbacteria bacterium GW2011_GWC2_52_8b]|uniref:UDP-N-acetylmuramoylalanine-D-glutamate ligase n=1 Tax=Candidatus Kaiserbacteria bacterium GW2011_GWC2_52_8b TaxID=1618676 RepID=A0A0G1XEK3_9BACT|nr:MAG: UDP-N-acetylmuramoylalanine-D-glutamate ligase [Candidatus Kaiserbacteria bacterium GW2011_GWC2_52_8b]
MEDFKGVPGRLEYLKTVRGVRIYNDNNATTPDATIAALRALSSKSQAPNHKQIQNPKALNANRSTLNTGAKRIILIMGGTDKGLDMSKLVAEIPKHCKAVILLKETGTDKLLTEFPHLKSPLIKGVPESARAGVVSSAKEAPHSDARRDVVVQETLKECVDEAMKIAEKGDIVLFSPAFASFGRWFKNEYDRGEQFVKIVSKF